MRTAFLDYILALDIPINSAAELPKVAEYFEANHKFESAAIVREWYDAINENIAEEFDEKCFPVQDAEYIEVLPTEEIYNYVNTFKDMVGADEDDWEDLPRPWYVCDVCGWYLDSPAHELGCRSPRL